jgi:hypothetical protein
LATPIDEAGSGAVLVRVGVVSGPDERLDLISDLLVGEVAAMNECVEDVTGVVADGWIEARCVDRVVDDGVERFAVPTYRGPFGPRERVRELAEEWP